MLHAVTRKYEVSCSQEVFSVFDMSMLPILITDKYMGAYMFIFVI